MANSMESIRTDINKQFMKYAVVKVKIKHGTVEKWMQKIASRGFRNDDDLYQYVGYFWG